MMCSCPRQPLGNLLAPAHHQWGASYPSCSLGFSLCPSWTSEEKCIISTFFLSWSNAGSLGFSVLPFYLTSTLALTIAANLNLRHRIRLAPCSGYPTHSFWHFEEFPSLSTKCSFLDCCFTAVQICRCLWGPKQCLLGFRPHQSFP